MSRVSSARAAARELVHAALFGEVDGGPVFRWSDTGLRPDPLLWANAADAVVNELMSRPALLLCMAGEEMETAR